jgi:hypothetical protein
VKRTHHYQNVKKIREMDQVEEMKVMKILPTMKMEMETTKTRVEEMKVEEMKVEEMKVETDFLDDTLFGKVNGAQPCFPATILSMI